MNDWKERLGMVYSTNSDYEYDTGAQEMTETLPHAKQRLRVALDKRNRGGKQVTVVADFRGTTEDLEDLAKRLKRQLGVGGSAKDGEVIIQGDHRDRVVALLQADGYTAHKI